jgi:hypothetical protein
MLREDRLLTIFSHLVGIGFLNRRGQMSIRKANCSRMTDSIPMKSANDQSASSRTYLSGRPRQNPAPTAFPVLQFDRGRPLLCLIVTCLECLGAEDRAKIAMHLPRPGMQDRAVSPPSNLRLRARATPPAAVSTPPALRPRSTPGWLGWRRADT